MQKFGRYIIGVLFLIVAIVVLVFIFNIFRSIFSNGDEEQSKPNGAFNLSEASDQGKSLRYTVRGQINGREEHRLIRITVTPENRKLEILQGYDQEVLSSQEFQNNRSAYDAFAEALNGAGFTARGPITGGIPQDQACPLGRHFIYEVAPGEQNSFHSWNTTCGKKNGNFRGKDKDIRTLFEIQIPDYDTLIQDVRLAS